MVEWVKNYLQEDWILNGTLWSANALLQEKYHQLLLDTHLDFIKSGAEVIVTNTFT